jgi:signal peptidase II
VFKKALLISTLIILFDQIVKIYIKTHFILGEEYAVAGNWFILHFTENNGMAFGFEFAGSWGKLFLSTFRVLAISGLLYYLYNLCKQKAHLWHIISISMVFAGALGNILDSLFYGVFFSDSYSQVAEFMPAAGGYAPMLYGKVVDMLYFPIIHSNFPAWFPIWGGEEFEFFSPVFNIADFSISCGVGLLVLNQNKFFNKPEEKSEESPTSEEKNID